MRTDRSFHKYMQHVNEVDGWLSDTTATVSHTLIRFQAGLQIAGNVCEIGVHHGRYFIALLTSIESDELAIAVDLFDNQAENLDKSGEGNQAKFVENISRFGNLDRVKIIQDNSLRVAPDQIVIEGHGIRFFSVDGGHTRSITESDLHLAERCVLPEGIVALDDILNPYWTGVISGFADYEKAGGQLVPFVMVPNKLLLCRSDRVSLYRAHLRAQFSHCINTEMEFFDHHIDMIEESNPTLFLPT